MGYIKKLTNNNYLKVFIIGFIAGLIPTFIFYMFIDPLASIWSLFVGLLLGVISTLTLILYKKYKIIGLISLILLITVYIFFLLILWEYRYGFFGGKFIG